MPVLQTSVIEDQPVDVKTAACFRSVSPSLMYAYVERKQIPHYRRSIGSACRNWPSGANQSNSMEESKHVSEQRKAP
jgi:hypothetical protein